LKKLTNSQIEKALAYVRGKMKPDEQLDFEISMSNNPALKEEVDFQSSIISALNLDGVEAQIDQARIENLLKQKKSHPKYEAIQKNLKLARTANASKTNQFKKILAFSIAILFVGAISIVGMSSSQEDKLSLSFLEITNSLDFQAILLPVGEYKQVDARITFINDVIMKARVSYENQNWGEALSYLQQIVDRNDLNFVEIQFYKSVLLFHQKDFQKSVGILENLDFENNSNFCTIQQFLILSYLNIDEKAKAENSFNTLIIRKDSCGQKTINNLGKYFK
jgi:hypothetical protein